jgi:hypothetical protein
MFLQNTAGVWLFMTGEARRLRLGVAYSTFLDKRRSAFHNPTANLSWAAMSEYD